MNIEPDQEFYKLMEGSTLYRVSFPCNSDGEGPFWDEHGNLEKFKDGYQEYSELMMVYLGRNAYRLAENPIFESPTTLNWGDEFIAQKGQSDTLEITQVKINQRFKHLKIVMRMDAQHPMSKKIHELGGGWESVAGGLLTISIPKENWKEFESL